MAKHKGVSELDFDNLQMSPALDESDVEDVLERSNFEDRKYRWQDDPRRYEEPKKRKRK